MGLGKDGNAIEVINENDATGNYTSVDKETLNKVRNKLDSVIKKYLSKLSAMKPTNERQLVIVELNKYSIELSTIPLDMHIIVQAVLLNRLFIQVEEAYTKGVFLLDQTLGELDACIDIAQGGNCGG